MTKQTLSIVALAMVGAVVPLSIATSASEVNCRVPFSFIVSGKSLPPGFYTVSTGHGYMILTGTHDGAVVLTMNGKENSNAGARLVFLKSGDRYDLIEVWSGDGSGLQIAALKPKVDRRLASNTPVERVVVLGDVATGSR